MVNIYWVVNSELVEALDKFSFQKLKMMLELSNKKYSVCYVFFNCASYHN